MTEVAPSIPYIIFLIFTGTAVLSTVALYTRQSLLVAYIAIGAILGPFGLKFVSNSNVVKEAGEIGIIFLLFLLGLHLQPQSLMHGLKKMSVITAVSSTLFFAIGFGISSLFGFGFLPATVIGIACMFSSTIIGLKLLPTTILHHQHIGELVISVLLLQDLIAIAVMLGLKVVANQQESYWSVALVLAAFPCLLLVAYVFARYILSRLLARFDTIHEYIFILAIGWCLCMSQISHQFGLSEEIGAFIAGIALASNPISLYIAECLKPLRDFFLVLFFFTIGAAFNFPGLSEVFLPASLLAITCLLAKPLIFRALLLRSNESKEVSTEIGVRMGQLSEFSLLVGFLAFDTRIIDSEARNLLEAAVVMTFIVSCYWTVLRYPTPLASSAALRRD